MTAPIDRDQAIERLLKQPMRPLPDVEPTASCLDGETLAAWADGALTGASLEMAQSHAAGCARCLALIGTFARIDEPVVAVAAPSPRRWLMWFVPLTAAAAAVALWVAIPNRDAQPVTQIARVEVPEQTAVVAPPAAPPARDTAPEEQRRQSVAAPSPPARSLQTPAPQPAAKAAAQLSAEPAGNVSADALAGARPPAAEAAPAVRPLAETVTITGAASQPPLAPAPAAQSPGAGGAQSAPVGALVAPAAPAAAPARAPALRAFAPPAIEIVSSDPAVRWRITGQSVERSTNSGAAWEPATIGVTAQLTAGAAPSPSVCWLVGRGGMVLLTTDGRAWRRVPFPVAADLTAVQSTDTTGRAATVIAADGATFATSDAGAVWTRR